MTQAHLIINIFNDGVFTAFIVCLAFPAVGLPKIGFWPWYKSEWGWNIVSLEEAITLALLPVWIRRFIHLDVSPLIWGWIDAVSIWMIPVIVLWRVYIIWKTQRYNKKDAKDNGNQEEVQEISK
jgi:hypothetical protein